VSSETLYPLSYYYPETLVAPDVAFRITGTVFDTSVEEVAKACEKHNPERDYSQGLLFTV